MAVSLSESERLVNALDDLLPRGTRRKAVDAIERALTARQGSVTARLLASRENRRKGQHERNLLLAWIIALGGYDAHLETPDDADDALFTRVLCIHVPSVGHLAWKLTDDDVKDFDLPKLKSHDFNGPVGKDKLAAIAKRPKRAE